MNGGNQVCVIDNKSIVISEVKNNKCTIECGVECNLLIISYALEWLKENNESLINGAFIDSYNILKHKETGKTIYLINTKQNIITQS